LSRPDWPLKNTHFTPVDRVLRKRFVETLRETFAHLDLTYSVGGQISFDVFPKVPSQIALNNSIPFANERLPLVQGWNKTYCLQYLEEFETVHFFGDKTYMGGNDYEIYTSERTVGHTVTSPDDTHAQVTALFL
jgi:phosphomannomutase